MYSKKYREEYGELVLCCDGYKSWRKIEYPFYKAKRKDTRDASKHDWTEIYKHIKTVEDEIREVFPYKMIRINKAEGDDVIGVIAKNKNPYEKLMIISADKDFIQLHKYGNVKQFSPLTKKLIVSDNRNYLKEHIIRGDAGDGVPNVLSPNDCFVNGVRQIAVFAKKIDLWVTQNPEEFLNEEQLIRYEENRKLIDLDETPEELQREIINSYEIPAEGKRSRILPYLMTKRMKLLIPCANDF